MRARAGEPNYGDAAQINRLRYAIYDNEGVLRKSSEDENAATPVNAGNGKWSLKLMLTEGDAYKVFFWADNSGNDAPAYALDYTAKTVTRTNWGVATTADLEDAFYCYQQFTAAKTGSFTLRRPLAQINVGSNEEGFAAGGEYNACLTELGFSATAANASPVKPSVFNYETGKVGVFATPAVQVRSLFENTAYKFPKYPTLNYVHMSYVFAPKTSDGWDLSDNTAANSFMFRIKKNEASEWRAPIYAVKAESMVTDWLLANTRVIITPKCFNPNDPDKPTPDEPGFISDEMNFSIVIEPDFDNTEEFKGE